jgi:hypothetical protein
MSLSGMRLAKSESCLFRHIQLPLESGKLLDWVLSLCL